MEFNEKLQELRRREGMTQEELASKLYVSRTAISKWESGRGYPNIESLKAISKLFSVTVDELLSSEEILTVAEEDGNYKSGRTRSFVIGLLDISAVLLLILPLFAQKSGEFVESVPLLTLSQAPGYLKIIFFALIFCTVILGIFEVALQSIKKALWKKRINITSFALSFLSILLFILSLKPYAAVFAFALLAIKSLIFIKR